MGDVDSRVFGPVARFHMIESVANLVRIQRLTLIPFEDESVTELIDAHRSAECFAHGASAIRALLKSDRRTLIGDLLSKHASLDWK